ncbi:MAG: helix-turn-helix domain-containing protein, partial [Nocardioides sp.]|uniref:TetR/AcrR family transcriptional regulator n=1 Tax=Nocardioides sp. TaxID=35761 RepID=UPI0032662FAE
MTPRATPLSAEDRRTTLIDATLPLLLEHGRTVTSKQIAEAAGIAEGTIFRVFDSKDDLIAAALDHAFDIEPLLDDLRRIEPDQSLRALVSDVVTLLQIRFRGIFELMTAVGMFGPPAGRKPLAEKRAEGAAIMELLLAPHAHELAVPVSEFVHITRLLTFSGSHPHLSDGRILTTD